MLWQRITRGEVHARGAAGYFTTQALAVSVRGPWVRRTR
jgi:hypothetical protein